MPFTDMCIRIFLLFFSKQIRFREPSAFKVKRVSMTSQIFVSLVFLSAFLFFNYRRYLNEILRNDRKYISTCVGLVHFM